MIGQIGFVEHVVVFCHESCEFVEWNEGVNVFPGFSCQATAEIAGDHIG